MTNRQHMLPSPCHSSPPAAISGHESCKSSKWHTCPQCNLLACRNFHFFALKEIDIRRYHMSAIQILALVSGLAGLGATIGATVSNEWRATSRASSVITATWVLQGLWNNCAGNAIGAVHCRPHHTIFQLQGKQVRVRSWWWLHEVCVSAINRDVGPVASNHSCVEEKKWTECRCALSHDWEQTHISLLQCQHSEFVEEFVPTVMTQLCLTFV